MQKNYYTHWADVRMLAVAINRAKIVFNTYFNLIFKIVNKLLPPYLSRHILLNREIHGHCTRIENNFRLPLSKKACTQNSLYYKGFKSFHTEVKNEKRLPLFKKHLNNI